MSLVTSAIIDPSIAGKFLGSSNEGVILRAGMFHVQEQSWKFSQRCHEQRVERTSSASSCSASRPRSDVEEYIAVSLNESRSVSDRSALLVAAETLNDKPDVVWSERTTAAVDTGGFCPTGAAVAREWYRWCAGQGKQVFDSASIANRDKYHPHFGELLHYLLSLYAFDGLVRRTLSQLRPLRRSIDLKSICSRAQRSGAHVVYVQLIFFFFWSLLCENGRDPLPPKRTFFVSQASANFCDGPLKYGKPINVTQVNIFQKENDELVQIFLSMNFFFMYMYWPSGWPLEHFFIIISLKT